ncbi:uncharacterized protein LOC116042083 isoform X5 [Sander lucioperca]|uniref:uncharacterized protein LOC116042083 isoform X5 n=1 Tax=Sander lucioperca TaxID=283035 RepID=UPI001653C1FD|nr:uncharacterized protein LOC116042083 isoform X5 [Sander lucioperca]
MRSGFPHSQAGAYSVFQDWSNVGARRLPQDFNVTPVPVVHPEVGKQNNMVATQYPEELRVTCSRVPLQQGYQSQKLYHQQESQATVTSTGFQHPRPGDGACISQNMQMSRKDNADFYSSAYVSAQHSSYFGTSAYENSVRLPDSNSGQQKEYSKQNFSWRFQNKSNWNHDTGLQQPLNCAFKDCTSSAALQGDRLEVPAQTFPLQDQCSSVTVCKKMSSSPLLEALLKGTSSELPWPSEETNGNIDLNTKAIILNKGHRKCQQVKGSPTVLNCGQARAQNLDHSTGTPSTPYQQQVSSRRLSSRPSTDKLMSAAKTRPPTDVEIQNFLAQRLMYFRSILTQKNTNPGHSNKDLDRNSTLQSDSIMPKVDGVARLPTTSAKDDVERQSHNWGANEQCTVGQARKEDSSKDRKVNGKLILKSKDTDDCATSASEKHSTEYPRIMMDVAATCTKNEDESPVVLTAVPQMTWDELTEKQPSSPDVSEELQTKSSSVASENQTFKCLPRIENQDANTKEKKTIEDRQQCGVNWKEVNPHSQLNSAVDSIQIHNIVSLYTNQSEGASEDAGETGPLYPQCDSGPFSEDETDDDDDDDDWLFIPITISDLKFESENEDQDSPEIHVLDGGETGQCDTSPTRWPSPTPVPASPPSQLETFDTMASFMKQALGRSTPDHGMDSEGNPQPTKTRRESVDSCATEDSCDYSSALTTAHNYLTVSTMRSAPLLSETDDSEGEGNDGTNMPRSPNKSLDKSAMKSLGWTNGQNIPTEGDIIILDSEDEGDQNCKTESVIIIDSDTDDDDQTPRRNCILSSGSDSGDAPCVEEKQPSPKAVDREYRMAKEKLPETKLPVANSSLPHPRPTLHDTQLKEATQDACSDLSDSRGKSGQPTEAKCGSEHVQHKTNRQTTSKRKAVCDSGKVVEKSHFSKKKAKTKGILSSGSGDGGDSLRATKNRPSAETVERLRGTASGKQPKKSRRSSDDSSEKQPQSVGREAEPTLGRNPVVPRFVIEKPLQHNHSLKLFKETAVHRQGKDGSRSPKTSTASSNNTDSYASKKVRFVPTSKPANDKRHATENIQANVKPRLFSRQHSLPTFSSSSSTSDQLSEARQSSASSRDFSRSISLPTAKQSTAIPKHTSSSSLQRSRSHRNPSSFNPPDGPANGPSSSGTVHSLRNKRAKEIWEESYIPTRKDKKTSPGMKEDLRTTTNNLKRAARPDPRRRQKSQKSSTPLMKKSKIEAIGMTKAAAIEMTKSAGRDPPGEQRSFVGDHYKWSEKPTVAKPTKGSSREGIRYRPAPKTHR